MHSNAMLLITVRKSGRPGTGACIYTYPPHGDSRVERDSRAGLPFAS